MIIITIILKYDHDNASGLIGELVTGRADLIVAPLTINPERAQVLIIMTMVMIFMIMMIIMMIIMMMTMGMILQTEMIILR